MRDSSERPECISSAAARDRRCARDQNTRKAGRSPHRGPGEPAAGTLPGQLSAPQARMNAATGPPMLQPANWKGSIHSTKPLVSGYAAGQEALRNAASCVPVGLLVLSPTLAPDASLGTYVGPAACTPISLQFSKNSAPPISPVPMS